MLKEIQGNNMTVTCNHCQKENVFDLSQKTSTYEFEFGQYENPSFECPDCHAIEIFNVNIPLDDTDEPFETGYLPVGEEIQRHYVRLLMRMVRPDLN
jgi:hypothetical protein